MTLQVLIWKIHCTRSANQKKKKDSVRAIITDNHSFTKRETDIKSQRTNVSNRHTIMISPYLTTPPYSMAAINSREATFLTNFVGKRL